MSEFICEVLHCAAPAGATLTWNYESGTKRKRVCRPCAVKSVKDLRKRMEAGGGQADGLDVEFDPVDAR